MGGKKLSVKSGVVANERINPFLNSGSCPGFLPMHQKPFLSRQSPTTGEGGTAGEPLSQEKGARGRMRKASPCSIDRSEPLMPSIALCGLVKAESVHPDKRGKEQAAILALFFIIIIECRGSRRECICCGLFALTLF